MLLSGQPIRMYHRAGARRSIISLCPGWRERGLPLLGTRSSFHPRQKDILGLWTKYGARDPENMPISLLRLHIIYEGMAWVNLRNHVLEQTRIGLGFVTQHERTGQCRTYLPEPRLGKLRSASHVERSQKGSQVVSAVARSHRDTTSWAMSIRMRDSCLFRLISRRPP